MANNVAGGSKLDDQALEAYLREVRDYPLLTREEEVELATQKFTSMLEPALIVVMALVVAVIVLSVLLPMLQISQSVGA